MNISMLLKPDKLKKLMFFTQKLIMLMFQISSQKRRAQKGSTVVFKNLQIRYRRETFRLEDSLHSCLSKTTVIHFTRPPANRFLALAPNRTLHNHNIRWENQQSFLHSNEQITLVTIWHQIKVPHLSSLVEETACS